MVKVDLHIHSTFSDGNLNYNEILEKASKLNIKEVSITDHDTIINLKNYRNLEKIYNLRIIPGIEIPANYPGMHILGYGISDFEKIENFLYNLKLYNEEQNIKTICVLKNNGIKIDVDMIRQLTCFNTITYRDIVNYLVKNGYAGNAFEVYEKFIGKGTQAYFPSKKATVKEVLEIINSSNGISVLAHPFTLNDDTNLDDLVCKMKSFGLDGIESYSLNTTFKQQQIYELIAQKYNLVKTVGTDFHNSNTDNLGIEVSDEYLKDFHDKVLKKY